MVRLLKSLPLLLLLCASVVHATPAFVSYGVTQPGRAVNLCTITPSAPIQVGDLLVTDYIAVPAFSGGTNACSTSSPSETWNCTPQLGNYTQVWWKIASLADQAAASFSFPAENSFNVCSMYDIRGVNQVTPVGTFVENTGTGTSMTIGATSGLPTNSMVLLLANQDDASVSGFSIATITPPGSPWTQIVNFNGDVSPFSASFAALYQTGVTSTAATTAAMSISDSWTTIAMPILAAVGTNNLQSVGGDIYPPISAQFIGNYVCPSGHSCQAMVTNNSTACVTGGAIAYTGPTSNVCRGLGSGATWKVGYGTAAPSGMTFNTTAACGTANLNGCNSGGIAYGAGGVALPTLRAGFHTYACATGDNTTGLQNAVNTASTAGVDLQILPGTGTCSISGTVTMASNQNVQCQNPSTTTIFNPNTAGGSGFAMLQYNGISNSTLSNCYFLGMNSTAPPGYPGCTAGSNTCNAGAGFSFFIGGGNNTHNITITDNVFNRGYNQAEIEFNGVPDDGNHFDYNSFFYCGIYGPNYDQATNSSIAHNYGFDCRLGNEPDCPSSSCPGTIYNLTGDTVNSNYNTRDQYGTGRNNTSLGTNPCDYSQDWTGCGMATQNQGCTSSNNVVVGVSSGACSGSPNISFITSNPQSTTPSPGENVSTTCASPNCRIYNANN